MRPVPGRAWARTSRSTGRKCSFSLVGARECVEGCDYLMFGRMRPERRRQGIVYIPGTQTHVLVDLVDELLGVGNSELEISGLTGDDPWRSSDSPIASTYPLTHHPRSIISFHPDDPAPDRVPYPPHGQEQTLGIHPIQANRAAPCLSALRPGACSASHPVHWTRMFNAPQCYRSPISVAS